MHVLGHTCEQRTTGGNPCLLLYWRQSLVFFCCRDQTSWPSNFFSLEERQGYGVLGGQNSGPRGHMTNVYPLRQRSAKVFIKLSIGTPLLYY